MATYAAQVHCLDRNIGRILRALRKIGAEQHTLVLFLSDNGASDQVRSGSLDREGDPWRRDGTPTQVGNKPSIRAGPADHFVTCGPPWANVSNTPFRGYKGRAYEGGIATPFIVRWPDVITGGGAISRQIGHITDIMATCLEVAGVSYPAEFRGHDVLPLEGRSLLPVLRGREGERHEAVCWELRGNRAVRMGRWKLVASGGGPWELYDMEADRTEMHDLAGTAPDRVAAMQRVFQRWTRGTKAGRR